MSERKAVVRIEEFNGVATDIHPARMAPSQFQTDQGGDLFSLGSWKLRRGKSRIPLTPMAAGIDTIFSFETRAATLALVLIDRNGNFRGYGSLTADGEAVSETDLDGFGVDGFGEGGFGA